MPNVATPTEHAWLSPDGELIPVDEWSHDAFARDEHDCTAEELECYGWIRLSEDCWQSTACTQAQLDAIFDWYRAIGCAADFRTAGFHVK